MSKAEYLKQYAEDNKEHLAEYQKEYAGKHQEELKQYRKEWYQENKNNPVVRFNQLKSSANRRNLLVGIMFEQYQELISKNVCYYCPNELPISGSGIDRLDHFKGYIMGNVVPCCWDCNARKGALERAGFKYPRTIELLKELLESEKIQ